MPIEIIKENFRINSSKGKSQLSIEYSSVSRELYLKQIQQTFFIVSGKARSQKHKRWNIRFTICSPQNSKLLHNFLVPYCMFGFFFLESANCQGTSSTSARRMRMQSLIRQWPHKHDGDDSAKYNHRRRIFSKKDKKKNYRLSTFTENIQTWIISKYSFCRLFLYNLIWQTGLVWKCKWNRLVTEATK